jgi:ABC-type transporter Mla subunit MlaD
MRKSKLIQLTSNLALVVAIAALAGCKSGNYEKGASTAAGLTESANKIGAAQGKIDAAVNSLNDLVNNPQGDLVPRFKKFNAAVSDLESSAKSVSGNVADMRSTGKEYFQKWDEQLATIKNEDIKSRSVERKNEVQTKFTNIKKTYEETAMAFKPFMAELKDIQSALSTDLTPGGVAALKGPADKVNKDAVPLKASVDKLGAQFKDLGVAMSSGMPQPAPAPAQ